jgi:hypothetical protein
MGFLKPTKSKIIATAIFILGYIVIGALNYLVYFFIQRMLSPIDYQNFLFSFYNLIIDIIIFILAIIWTYGVISYIYNKKKN